MAYTVCLYRPVSESSIRRICIKAVLAPPPPPPPTLTSGHLEVIMDRRLMQDDNRGLGQGLKDNKKTGNRFRLLLERRSTGNKVSKMTAKVVVEAGPSALKIPAPPHLVLSDFYKLCARLCCVLHSTFISTIFFFPAFINTPSVFFFFLILSSRLTFSLSSFSTPLLSA